MHYFESFEEFYQQDEFGYVVSRSCFANRGREAVLNVLPFPHTLH